MSPSSWNHPPLWTATVTSEPTARDRHAAEPAAPALHLRRNLLAVAALALLLPLLIVYAALTGMVREEAANAESTSLLTAQRYQLEVDEAHDALMADVLTAMLPVEQRPLSQAALQQQTRQHATELRADLARLNEFTLADPSTALLRQLDPQLQAFTTQAESLADLAYVNRPEAANQLVAFETSYQQLDSPQTQLTALIDSEAAAARATADAAESAAVRWTWLAAGLTMVALLGLAYLMHRIGSTNERLLRRLQDNARELAARNEQLDAAQAVAHVGSWEWSPATGETRWSAELYQILGLSPDTPGELTDLFMPRVHPEDADRVEAEGLATLQSAEPHESQYRIVRPDGTVRDVQARTVAVTDHDGTRALVGTLQDVTELRAAQRAKDEFISVVSHELRTPLTSIRGALGLLAGGAVGPLSDKAQRMAEVAVTSSDRLVRLINDILDVEKMAAGKLQLDLAPQSADALVTAAVREMRPMADQAGVVLVTDQAEGTVLADRDRMAQTLTNLISNAIKFSPVGGFVTVSAAVDHNQVRFTVTDQGRGIPADQLEAIFDRFQQVDASNTREKGGTGLGLPICRAIVEQHGGRIWATSEEGKGSTLEFTLPSAGADSQDPGAAREALPVGAVLICDDDPDVLEVLATMLEAHGYTTLRAHNGRAALDLAIRQAPSLILMDLLMPGMSGWETIAALNANPATADIPVVILSALGPQDTEQKTKSHWLTKPIDAGALLRTLRRALNGDVGPSVVVVEDDPQLASVLKAFFLQHGLHTTVTSSGRQALTTVQAAPPDMIVLDIGLPDIDGYALVDALRQDERLASIPLVVYTGADLTEGDRRRLQLGETRFVVKGSASSDTFQRQVLALLHSIVRSHQSARPEAELSSGPGGPREDSTSTPLR